MPELSREVKPSGEPLRKGNGFLKKLALLGGLGIATFTGIYCLAEKREGHSSSLKAVTFEVPNMPSESKQSSEATFSLGQDIPQGESKSIDTCSYYPDTDEGTTVEPHILEEPLWGFAPSSAELVADSARNTEAYEELLKDQVRHFGVVQKQQLWREIDVSVRKYIPRMLDQFGPLERVKNNLPVAVSYDYLGSSPYWYEIISAKEQMTQPALDRLAQEQGLHQISPYRAYRAVAAAQNLSELEAAFSLLDDKLEIELIIDPDSSDLSDAGVKKTSVGLKEYELKIWKAATLQLLDQLKAFPREALEVSGLKKIYFVYDLINAYSHPIATNQGIKNANDFAGLALVSKDAIILEVKNELDGGIVAHELAHIIDLNTNQNGSIKKTKDGYPYVRRGFHISDDPNFSLLHRGAVFIDDKQLSLNQERVQDSIVSGLVATEYAFTNKLEMLATDNELIGGYLHELGFRISELKQEGKTFDDLEPKFQRFLYMWWLVGVRSMPENPMAFINYFMQTSNFMVVRDTDLRKNRPSYCLYSRRMQNCIKASGLLLPISTEGILMANRPLMPAPPSKGVAKISK